MLEHDSPVEGPFSDRWDCCFPYDDRAMASAIIKQGWSISLNAAFIVLWETCIIPRGEKVTKLRQQQLLEEWNAAGPQHPLKKMVVRYATANIMDARIPLRECLETMQHIGQYEGQRAALWIVASAADAWDMDAASEERRTLEDVNDSIMRAWDAKGV